jgi:multidrug resistance efflux pump
MSDPNPGRPAPDGASLSDRVRSLRLSDQQASRPPRTRWLPWAITSVLLLTSVAFGYRAYRVGGAFRDLEAGKDVAREAKKHDSTSGGIPTTSVASSGEVVLQAKGYVIPISLVQVSPKIGGQLWRIHASFKEGNRFKKDDVLAWIEDVDYRAERDQARASHEAARARYEEARESMPLELKQAEHDLEEAKETAEQLRLELDRNKRLARGNAVAMKDLEQAQYSYTSTVARVKKLETTIKLIRLGRLELRVSAARAEMDQARAVLEKAQWRLDNTQIRAPISGTILTKKAEEGNIVNPSAFSSGISASLCEMADLTQLEIDLSIQERDIAQVKKGQVCWVMPEAYQADKEFLQKYPKGYAGVVSRLMPTADRAKGAVPVRVEIKNIPEAEAGVYLRPDMGALVSFMRGPASSATSKKK